MKSRLLGDVVVAESAFSVELLACKDQSLGVSWDPLLVLDFGLDAFNGICGLNLKGDSLSSESSHKDLHSTAQAEDEMDRGLLLNVVVADSSLRVELLSCEDESLLISGNSFLVLDFSFYVLDGVGRLDLEGDGLSGKGLNEDLHVLVLVGKRLWFFFIVFIIN